VSGPAANADAGGLPPGTRVALGECFLGGFRGHHLKYALALGEALRRLGLDARLWALAPRSGELEPIRSDVPVTWLEGRAPGDLAAACLRHARSLPAAEAPAVIHLLKMETVERAYARGIQQHGGVDAPALCATLMSSYRPTGRPVFSHVLTVLRSRAVQQMFAAGQLDGLFLHHAQLKELLTYPPRPLPVAMERRIHVVPDPSDDWFGDRSAGDARRRLDLPDDRPVLLFFGDLRRNKGPDLLLQAVGGLSEACTLVLAGEAIDVTEAAVRSAPLPEHVRLVARVRRIPETEVQDYFTAADWVLLPYRPNKLVTSGILQTAAAAGRPVVAHDVGVIGPTVHAAGLGLTSRPEPAAFAAELGRALAGGAPLRDSFRPALRRYAAAHSWDRMARETAAGYARSLALRPAPGAALAAG
jgi:glycosyltransferase involved in cell wall biosynthesis